jgi:hypothetical protein
LTMALAGVGARVNSSVVAKIASNRLIEASLWGVGDHHRNGPHGQPATTRIAAGCRCNERNKAPRCSLSPRGLVGANALIRA